MARIVLTGGGTGGHIYPLIAVAEALQAKSRGVSGGGASIDGDEPFDLHYVGSVGEYRTTFEEQGITVHSIAGAKIRRYFSLMTLLDIPKFFIALFQAWITLFFLMPDAIFSKGGTSAFPVLLAGWFYRIPIMIHESDAVPGLNNVLGSRCAARIAVSFEGTRAYFNPAKTILTGNPIRKELLSAAVSLNAQGTTRVTSAKQELGFDPARPLMLVLGGSQGSERINDLILLSLAQLATTTQLLHQTGAANYVDVTHLSRAALSEVPIAAGHVPLRYDAVPYFERTMGTALAAADLVVSRGSSTIFEIAAFCKPAILIPLLESANNHQTANAYAFADAGASVVIEEPNLLPEIFITQVKRILADDALRAKMAAASKTFAIDGAAEQIADELAELI